VTQSPAPFTTINDAMIADTASTRGRVRRIPDGAGMYHSGNRAAIMLGLPERHCILGDQCIRVGRQRQLRQFVVGERLHRATVPAPPHPVPTLR
jgi:hypothetical protein